MALFGKYKNEKSRKNQKDNEPDIYTRLFEDAEESRRDAVQQAFRNAGLSDEQFQKYYVTGKEMTVQTEQSIQKAPVYYTAPAQITIPNVQGNQNTAQNGLDDALDLTDIQCPIYHPYESAIIQPTQSSSQSQSQTQLINDAGMTRKGELSVNSSSLFGVSKTIGRRRSQQDALAVSDPNIKKFDNQWFAVLCDGMGGMSGGEKASALCVKLFLKACVNHIDDVVKFYQDLLPMIDEEVALLENDNGGPLGGGSTFISACIDNGLFYWASVGDSHIYFIRDNKIVRVNVEHNYMADLLEMVKDGEITYEEACADKNKEALTSYMGIGNLELMDISCQPVRLIPGDKIVLCSDGLYRSVSNAEIMQVVLSNGNNMQKAADNLINYAMAKNNPYQDNTSVVVIRYE